RPVAIRTRLAEAGDRAVHELGVQRLDVVVTHAALFQRAGTKILYDDVRAGGELKKNLPRLVFTNIERDAFFIAVEAAEIRGVKIVAPAAERIALPRLLDLDDVGAEVGEQQRGERSGHIARDLDYAD